MSVRQLEMIIEGNILPVPLLESKIKIKHSKAEIHEILNQIKNLCAMSKDEPDLETVSLNMRQVVDLANKIRLWIYIEKTGDDIE